MKIELNTTLLLSADVKSEGAILSESQTRTNSHKIILHTMAPRPPEKTRLSKAQNRKLRRLKSKATRESDPKTLLTEATTFLEIGQADDALRRAAKALSILEERSHSNAADKLPALNLLGEILIELGETQEAREFFMKAADIDPEGEVPEALGGGPEKFFWLAQLSDEGGLDSVKWYQKGADVLRREIEKQTRDETRSEEQNAILEEQTAKLASALCGIAEIYMTDLSWDDKEAEEQCNEVMEEATRIAPDSVETLQTLASVKISQLRQDEAKEYLSKSLSLWKDLPPEDAKVPTFPTKISLSRLLMEVEMEGEALEVLERLITEDDRSVEAWYLGGWCQHLLAEKKKSQMNGDTDDDSASEMNDTLRTSRKWLLQCLKLYQLQGYEDVRLHDHATEIVESLNQILGEPTEEDGVLEEQDVWEDAEESGNELMEGT